MQDLDEPIVDATVHHVQDMAIHHDAEDVKTIRFSDETTTVDVGITDDSMVEFLEVAEEVYDSIHADMAELKELFEEVAEDRDRRE